MRDNDDDKASLLSVARPVREEAIGGPAIHGQVDRVGTTDIRPLCSLPRATRGPSPPSWHFSLKVFDITLKALWGSRGGSDSNSRPLQVTRQSRPMACTLPHVL